MKSCSMRSLIRKVRHFQVPQTVILTFVHQCVLSVILYCSPVIFPGLRKEDYVVLRRGLSIISRASGIPLNNLLHVLCNSHVAACESFALKILQDPSHPLHNALSPCISHANTRSKYRLLPSRISLYRNSLIPYLARILVDREKSTHELHSNFRI